jgi:hypothetical protein
MKQRTRRLLLIALVGAAIAVCAGLGFKALKLRTPRQPDNASNFAGNHGNDAELWARAVERVKEDRSADPASAGAIEIPPEMRHYTDRHWFLATQVAEVRKFNLQSCQDFVDLASMIERGEMVSLPAVTDTYVLFGVGAKADDGVFTRYIDDQNVGLYDENELRAAYTRLESARASLEKEISGLQKQSGALKKGDRARRTELQKQITERGRELEANKGEKALLDQSYAQPDSKQKLWRDYQSLQTLAKNFGGRSFDLSVSSDRRAMKVNMLSSLRPEALKVLEEVARQYHDKFDRPLPVSSLVRPEQYQHVLRRVNRNAVLIDTPPHSTGLAFDIDYRYMGGGEQNFLMTELSRMKDEGRIEVIRERNANYHVFVFLDGRRPADDLITASLSDAGAPVEEPTPAVKTPAKPESKTRIGKKAKDEPGSKKTTSKSKARKRR